MRLSDIMSHMDLTVYPIVGLVIFLFVFVSVVARVMSRSRRAEYARGALLPLDDSASTDQLNKQPQEGVR